MKNNNYLPHSISGNTTGKNNTQTVLNILRGNIKPCPFCGSEAVYETNIKKDGHCSYKVGYIRCSKCECQTPSLIIDGYYGVKTKKEDVYKIWNKRN